MLAKIIILLPLLVQVQQLQIASSFSFQFHPNQWPQPQSRACAHRCRPLLLRTGERIQLPLQHLGICTTITSSASSKLFMSPPSPSTSTSTSLTFIEGVQSIADSYDTFLLDMWGVMHDGKTTYEGVIHTVEQLLQKGNSDDNNSTNKRKKLIILSNSSKRLSNAKKMLTKLGFDPDDDFVQIITSGDISYRMLSGEGSSTLGCSTWDILDECNVTDSEDKKNVFVFGSGDGDEEYVTSCGWTLCTNIERANLIVARGTFTIYTDGGNDDDTDGVVVVSKTVDEGKYTAVLEETLEKASNLQIPMLVTNPDKVRPDKGLPPMPGAIGDAYEKYLHMGEAGSHPHPLVKRIGKPYPEVYDIALSLCSGDGKGDIDRSRVIMVGDALETDITGGTRSNIDTLWVVDDGIHAPFVEELMKENGTEYESCVETVLDGFNDSKQYTGDERLRPTFVTKHFQW